MDVDELRNENENLQQADDPTDNELARLPVVLLGLPQLKLHPTPKKVGKELQASYPDCSFLVSQLTGKVIVGGQAPKTEVTVNSITVSDNVETYGNCPLREPVLEALADNALIYGFPTISNELLVDLGNLKKRAKPIPSENSIVK